MLVHKGLRNKQRLTQNSYREAVRETVIADRLSGVVELRA